MADEKVIDLQDRINLRDEVATNNEEMAEAEKAAEAEVKEEKPETVADALKKAEANEKLKEKLAAMPEDERYVYEKVNLDPEFVVTRNIIAMQNELNAMRGARDHAKNKLLAMCPDSRMSIIESRVNSADIDAIAKLDMTKDEEWEKVHRFYVMDDGSEVHFSAEPDTKDKMYREMHRDYLVYLRKTHDETVKFEAYETQAMAEIESLSQELDKMIGIEDSANRFKSIGELYRKKLTALANDENVPVNARTKINSIIDAMNDGLSLRKIIEEVRSLIARKGDASSLKYGYRSNFFPVAQRAGKILATKFAKYNYHIQFQNLDKFEERTLDGRYKEYTNLFMFILFRYIRSNYEKFGNREMIVLGEIITQMGFMLRAPEQRPETNKEFEKHYIELMELVINH